MKNRTNVTNVSFFLGFLNAQLIILCVTLGPYSSSDRSSLTKHDRTHTNIRPYKCQICSYASRNSSQLVVHLRTHTGDTPFPCSLCPSTFKINSDLKRHMRTHTGEKPFKCSICERAFAIKGNLQMHLKVNHSDSKLKCDVCQFETCSKKKLKEHKRHHSLRKPLKCDQCPYSTKVKSALNSHILVHTKEKPYACHHCDYSCRQLCNLKTHMKKKHPEQEEVGPNETSVVSQKSNEPICRKEKKNSKGNTLCQATFICNQCPAKFVREDSLRSHIRHHTTGQLSNQRIAVTPNQHDEAAEVLVLSDVTVDSNNHTICQIPNGMCLSQSDMQLVFNQLPNNDSAIIVVSDPNGLESNSNTILQFVTSQCNFQAN